MHLQVWSEGGGVCVGRVWGWVRVVCSSKAVAIMFLMSLVAQWLLQALILHSVESELKHYDL